MTQCGKDPLAVETDAAVSRGLWEAGKGQKTQTPPRRHHQVPRNGHRPADTWISALRDSEMVDARGFKPPNLCRFVTAAIGK